MKKLTLTLTICLIILISGCKKEEEKGITPLIEEQINIALITSQINKSVAGVKIGLKDYLLLSEETTLGKVNLNYSLFAKEANFVLNIEFNTSGIAKDVMLVTTEDYGYSKAINLTKSLSDRFQAAFSSSSYTAFWYYNYSSSKKTYSIRNDFWTYITNNGVNDKTVEYWLLDLSKNYMAILNYTKLGNSIISGISSD